MKYESRWKRGREIFLEVITCPNCRQLTERVVIHCVMYNYIIIALDRTYMGCIQVPCWNMCPKLHMGRLSCNTFAPATITGTIIIFIIVINVIPLSVTDCAVRIIIVLYCIYTFI